MIRAPGPVTAPNFVWIEELLWMEGEKLLQFRVDETAEAIHAAIRSKRGR